MNGAHPKDTLGNTVEWFQKARPAPTDEHLRVQTGVHFEEVGEMLEQLACDDEKISLAIQDAEDALKNLAKLLKSTAGAILVVKSDHDLLDALCDQIVTAVGVAHMRDLGILGAMDEVNLSNFSKFVDGQPLFDENGKVMKGPGWIKANLQPFV